MEGAAVTAALSAVAGIAVLAVALIMDQLVSVGGALGVLLLLNAAVRLEIARRA